MNVPFNFLNKNDINDIDHIVNIYLIISTEGKRLISYTEKEYILKSFFKRQLIDSETLVNLCSVIILVIFYLEKYKPYEIEIDTEKTRSLLLKIVIYHSDKISDECFENNIRLFKYIYRG